MRRSQLKTGESDRLGQGQDRRGRRRGAGDSISASQRVDTRVRIFNTFGARMRPQDGRAIPTFLRLAVSEKPVTVFGDGSQPRSF
jgi:NAD dependent epimerase/dehydratase family